MHERITGICSVVLVTNAVLLLGSGGMLAQDVLKTTPDGVELTALSRQQLDIRDTEALERAIVERRPDWVFNCAGLANVDAAERDRDVAFAVNATAVEEMAKLCRKHGVRLLHFSSDYVFDGTASGFYSEDDAPHPINIYGESKLAGEEGIRRSGARHLLIRPQWLFGSSGRSFVGLMYERARSRQPTRTVDDQWACCTYTVDLARVTWDLLGRFEGTVNVANRGKVSRYTIAARIFEHFGAGALVTPCSTADFASTTRRPANSALSVRRVEEILGRQMGGWKDALDCYLAEMAKK